MDLAYLSDFVCARKGLTRTLLPNEDINAILIAVALWMDSFELLFINLCLVRVKALAYIMVKRREI